MLTKERRLEIYKEARETFLNAEETQYIRKILLKGFCNAFNEILSDKELKDMGTNPYRDLEGMFPEIVPFKPKETLMFHWFSVDEEGWKTRANILNSIINKMEKDEA